MIVIWKEKGLRLRVLGSKEGRFGERRLVVQKETAESPFHGLFSLKPDQVDVAN